MYRWEFARRGEEFKLEVQGAITLDHIGLMVTAAIKGLGRAIVVLRSLSTNSSVGRTS